MPLTCRFACQFLCCLAVLLPALARAQTAALSFIDAAPGPEVVLARDEALYVRLGYRSDVEIMITATGVAGGQALSGRNGGSPIYPAGDGEALFWISYAEATEIGSIRLQATTPDGHDLTGLTVPLSRRWDPAIEPALTPSPEWVARLEAPRVLLIKRKPLKKKQAAAVPDFVRVWLFPLTAFACAALQVFAWLRFPGGWRIAGALPAGAMLLLLAGTAYGFFSGFKLWHLIPIVGTPPIFAWLGVTTIAWWLAGRPSRGAAPAAAPQAEP